MMLLSMIVAAAVQSAAPETIVVTGVPLSQLKREAERCEKGGCTPREDIVATVRYAEGLFRVGRYVESRVKLQKAITRNKVVGRRDPPALSALYEATTTIARHEGDQYVMSNALYARARLLRETSPDDSIERLLSDLDVIDYEGQRVSSLQADAKYKAFAARAISLRQYGLAARAMIHHAMFAQFRGREPQVTGLLNDVMSGRFNAPVTYRLVARAIAARFARERGDEKGAETLISQLVAQPQGATPMLIWSPPVPKVPGSTSLDPFTSFIDTTTVSSDYFKIRWVDIGFTIRSDGTVDSPEVLRGNRTNTWAKPLLQMIADRRYAPLAANSELGYRVERWTLTADYDVANGSLIRRRLRNPHFEQLDLSGEPPKSVSD